MQRDTYSPCDVNYTGLPTPALDLPGVRLAIASFIPSRGAERRAIERGIARRLLAELLGDTSSELPYLHEPNGRPRLPEPHTEQLSISHTEGYVACAVSEIPIGVDVERWGEQVMRILPRFLSPEECAMVHAAEHPQHLAHILWSAKESAYKLAPPTSHSLLDFSLVHILPPTEHAYGRMLIAAAHTPRPICVHYTTTPDYVLTLALWAESQ